MLGACGREPSVTVYASADESVARPVFERFERETGIRVDAKFDTEATKTTGLANLLRAEKDRPRADVFWSNEQAANVALAAEGAAVGILDADIYGPSQPMMLGISGRPESNDGKSLEPMEGHGRQAISIGFLIDIDTPMVRRGPMVTQALEQLLKDTRWRELDYLVVDLPPGTGDIQLTLAQKVPVTGAVIVTTPQDIALIDARKGLKMFEKVGVPIVGVVENMSIHVCSNCGHAEPIFGEGGGEKMCADYKVPFLGGLPLDIRIREQTDAGRPTVIADPEGKIAHIYREIARKTAVFVAQKAEDFSAKFPSIVIQNT